VLLVVLLNIKIIFFVMFIWWWAIVLDMVNVWLLAKTFQRAQSSQRFWL